MHVYFTQLKPLWLASNRFLSYVHQRNNESSDGVAILLHDNAHSVRRAQWNFGLTWFSFFLSLKQRLRPLGYCSPQLQSYLISKMAATQPILISQKTCGCCSHLRHEELKNSWHVAPILTKVIFVFGHPPKTKELLELLMFLLFSIWFIS